MTLADIEALTHAHHLDIFGAFHSEDADDLPTGTETLVLLGPKEPGFWSAFKTSPEWQDNAPDPMDRWSMRVISGLAAQLDAVALYPFGGPPYQPFFRWALRSGQAWQSPVSLLVHCKAGLMVSYRGALALRDKIDLPPGAEIPCITCEKPCLTACKAEALTADGYDVPKCHAYLDTENGRDNINLGCGVRRSCPISQSYGRLAEQSAYHMSLFHR